MEINYHPTPPSNSPAPGKVKWSWLQESWNLFSQDAGIWIGAIVVYWAISFVVQLVFQGGTQASMMSSQMARPGAPPPTPAQMLQTMPWGTIGWLNGFAMLLGLFKSCSFLRMAMKKVRYEPLTFSDAFSGGPLMPSMLLLYLFIGIFILAGAILMGYSFVPLLSAGANSNPALISQYMPTLITGMVLMFVGWLFAIVCIMPAFAMVADRVSPGTAISTSFNAMKRDWPTALLFVLGAGFLLTLATLLTCGLGAFATAPMFYLISALAYRDMVGIPGVQNPFLQGYPPPGTWPPASETWPPPPTSIPPQSGTQAPYYGQPPYPNSPGKNTGEGTQTSVE